MITLEDSELHFTFPNIHKDASCGVGFIRTLRIPDDNRAHPLPPGFSRFPLEHVDDYAERLPEAWKRHGGVFLPMHQAEAVWLGLHGFYPVALKIAAGKINALTGEPWSEGLNATPRQDYVVVPGQPWLDGFYAGKGLIRQFVAMPLGEGYTAEEQLTGAAEHGGLQLIAYPMKAERYRQLMETEWFCVYSSGPFLDSAPPAEMGLAPGGMMRQEIYDDPYGIDAWEQSVYSRCFVHLLNAPQYAQATGKLPPTMPPTAADYIAAGLPWFDYHNADLKALEQASKLLGLKSVGALSWEKTGAPLPGNEPTGPVKVVQLGPGANLVREGEV